VPEGRVFEPGEVKLFYFFSRPNIHTKNARGEEHCFSLFTFHCSLFTAHFSFHFSLFTFHCSAHFSFHCFTALTALTARILPFIFLHCWQYRASQGLPHRLTVRSHRSHSSSFTHSLTHSLTHSVSVSSLVQWNDVEVEVEVDGTHVKR
jgi:hypothetical protein